MSKVERWRSGYARGHKYGSAHVWAGRARPLWARGEALGSASSTGGTIQANLNRTLVGFGTEGMRIPDVISPP